jgi:signal peptidase II
MSAPFADTAAPGEGGPSKARLFWPAVLVITVGDVLTKYWALRRLEWGEPVRVAGDVFRLRLNYNPGAAFGMYLGPHSRWIFLALALVILVVLGSMYRQTAPGERAKALALGLVCGGAIGNVINRLWSPRGVVDFLDFGVGDTRWPTFNVADIGVTTGAVLLAWILWREDNVGKEPGNAQARKARRGAAAEQGEER